MPRTSTDTPHCSPLASDARLPGWLAADAEIDAACVASALQLDLRGIGAGAPLEHVADGRRCLACGKGADVLRESRIRRARRNITKEIATHRPPALDAAGLRLRPIHAEDLH